MPQLDIFSFPNQVFWLIIALLTIYLFAYQFIIPSILFTLHARRYIPRIFVKYLRKAKIIMTVSHNNFESKFQTYSKWVQSFGNKYKKSVQFQRRYQQRLSPILIKHVKRQRLLSILFAKRNLIYPFLQLIGPYDDLILGLAFVIVIVWLIRSPMTNLIKQEIQSKIDDITNKLLNKLDGYKALAESVQNQKTAWEALQTYKLTLVGELVRGIHQSIRPAGAPVFAKRHLKSVSCKKETYPVNKLNPTFLLTNKFALHFAPAQDFILSGIHKNLTSLDNTYNAAGDIITKYRSREANISLPENLSRIPLSNKNELTKAKLKEDSITTIAEIASPRSDFVNGNCSVEEYILELFKTAATGAGPSHLGLLDLIPIVSITYEEGSSEPKLVLAFDLEDLEAPHNYERISALISCIADATFDAESYLGNALEPTSHSYMNGENVDSLFLASFKSVNQATIDINFALLAATQKEMKDFYPAALSTELCNMNELRRDFASEPSYKHVEEDFDKVESIDISEEDALKMMQLKIEHDDLAEEIEMLEDELDGTTFGIFDDPIDIPSLQKEERNTVLVNAYKNQYLYSDEESLLELTLIPTENPEILAESLINTAFVQSIHEIMPIASDKRMLTLLIKSMTSKKKATSRSFIWLFFELFNIYEAFFHTMMIDMESHSIIPACIQKDYLFFAFIYIVSDVRNDAFRIRRQYGYNFFTQTKLMKQLALLFYSFCVPGENWIVPFINTRFCKMTSANKLGYAKGVYDIWHKIL